MKKLIAANWKMYKNTEEVEAFFKIFLNKSSYLPDDREVAIFAPHSLLKTCSNYIANHNISLGGQNFYPAKEGAYTGETSAQMLLDAGCNMVLVGHSERRKYFLESDDFLKEKTAFALNAGLKVILCIGETLEEREGGKLEAVLQKQLQIALSLVKTDKDLANKVYIAYEPVWAIGTGKVAGKDEILKAHALIRNILKEISAVNFLKMRILYGGSVKLDNVAEIIKLDNVDGVLVGGASLEAESFCNLILY